MFSLMLIFSKTSIHYDTLVNLKQWSAAKYIISILDVGKMSKGTIPVPNTKTMVLFCKLGK